jgi:hypothetical protein
MKQDNWKALLMHGFLRYESRIHIAQCILPKDQWITDDRIVAFPDTTISQINEFLPPKKLTNFMITDFIERCMMKNQGQVKLVNSLTYETFFKSEKYRQKCFEEKDNYSLYLCVILVEHHHWVIVEIENPQKQNQKIVLSIADGCRPQHKFPMNLAAQKYFLYYAAVMFSDEYANKFTGSGDKVLCESLAKPELYFSTFQLQHASYVLRQINKYDCGVLCIMRMALTIVCKKFGLCLNDVIMPEPRIYRFKIIEIILRCNGITDLLEPDAQLLPPVELLSFIGADGSNRFNFITKLIPSPHFTTMINEHREYHKRAHRVHGKNGDIYQSSDKEQDDPREDGEELEDLLPPPDIIGLPTDEDMDWRAKFGRAIIPQITNTAVDILENQRYFLNNRLSPNNKDEATATSASLMQAKMASFETNQGDEETSSEEEEFHQVDDSINAGQVEMDTVTLVSENQFRPGSSKLNK